MVAGHLREQNGNYQMILSWKDGDGKRRGKSISTGLPVKGNKKRAEAMLLKVRREFDPENHMENGDMPFVDFINKWLKEQATSYDPATYAEYAHVAAHNIIPYFIKHPQSLQKLNQRALREFYLYERGKNRATINDVRTLHETVVAVIQYAVELAWLKDNFASMLDPCEEEVPVLFTDFLLEWLEMMKNSVELTTFSSYATCVKKSIIPFFESKGLTLQDLERNPKHIQDYYQHELNTGLTANTVIHRHANIRKCLQYAFQIGLIKSNPADRVERPRKVRYVATIYNQEELEKLFQTVHGDPVELGVILAAFYGLRRSEIAGLKWEAIDFEKKTFTIKHTVTQVFVEGKEVMVQKDRTKTKSSYRTLPLVPPFEELLHRLKQEQQSNRKACGMAYCEKYLEYVYVNELGDLIKPNYITQHFEIVLKKHGLKKIRFHDLRHSCASLLYANGVSLKEIQEWLGHSDIGTTSNIYTHLDYSSKVASANAILAFYPGQAERPASGQ